MYRTMISLLLSIILAVTVFAETNQKAYANFDFVAGDSVLFEDDLQSSTDGEFPPMWKLVNGQAVVNRVDNELALIVTEGSYGRVAPRIRQESYLDSVFTVELDFKIGEEEGAMFVFFRDPNGEDMRSIHVDAAGETSSDYFPEPGLTGAYRGETSNFKQIWHHLSIAFKKNQMKIYVDQHRTLTIPECGFIPTSLLFGGSVPITFKNVRIANGGGMFMLEQIYKEGKIVTRGILFDVNKSSLKPQSMGTINEIVKLLKQDVKLKISIEGHTDSDGDAAANQKLSEDRAIAVKNALVTLGIDATRLQTKGWGESNACSDNNTPAGKANNRRVELVKVN